LSGSQIKATGFAGGNDYLLEKQGTVMLKKTLLILIMWLLSFTSITAIQYTYDNLNRLIRVEYDNGSIIEYQYDGAGNRIQKAVTAPPCYGSMGGDGDVDGSDLWNYIAGGSFADLGSFAASFGRTNCP
jgi:YD repeat-containing protein